ncbi:FAD/NAD(P)-binding protein [Lacticigenium naphthae]|uniref:FAD/NAD(P)-binding protein n=1 Tax=Lacticigenium naphthae TaxID=515351 RepID=UPI0003FA3855|nr:FAD/NAD(P)-binding protein [Lacticigenium naphthae]
MKVAIIGLGVAGSGILKELINHQSTERITKIDIYEPNEKLGHGFPYQSDHKDVQMNSYAQDLSLHTSKQDDFLDWLQENYPERNFCASDFVSRSIFGQYLVDRLKPFLSDERINHFQTKAIDMMPLNREHNAAWNELDKPLQYVIQDEQDKWSDAYDAVFFAFGHAPYADHYQLSGHKNYIHDPYPIEKKLGQIDDTKRIGIIGSGLTGLDTMYFLLKNYKWVHPVTFYIRQHPFTTVKSKRYEGNIQLTISEKWLADQKKTYNGQIPLKVIKKQLFSDLKANSVNWIRLIDLYGKGSVFQVEKSLKENDPELARLQRYLGQLTPLLPELNMALNPLERKAFWEKEKKTFEHFRSQMPENRIQFILDKMEQGQARIIKGLDSITSNQDSFKIVTDKMEMYPADVLINAAGFEKKLVSAGNQDDLIKNLYKREIIIQDGIEDIQVSWPSCQVLSKRFGQMDRVYLLGNWIFQTQFGNNNAKLNNKQGQASAKHFMDSL